MKSRIRHLEKKFNPRTRKETDIEVRLYGLCRPGEEEPGVKYERYIDSQFPHIELMATVEPFKVLNIKV